MENFPSPKSNFQQLPYSVRLCFQLLLVLLIVFIITRCQSIFVPLYFSVLLSILLLPIVNLLEKIGLPRALAGLVAVLFAFAIIVFIIYILSAQVISFLNDIPAIKAHLSEHFEKLQGFIKQRFDISTTEQNTLFNTATAGVQDSGMVYIKQTFYTITQMVAFIIFIFIYSFLILFYRSTIKKFLLAVFSVHDKKIVDAVITGSKQVIRNYMTGLVIEMAIISTCNSLVLSMIGIKYAIFLGVFTGILNIMPFLGIYTGIIFTVLITLTTSATMNQISWIFIGLLLVHFIDSNFLMPKIVGSKVKINALITILGALAGGLLLGIAGVFLALPTIAILKIIFDRIEGMKPWGILFGDESAFPAKKMLQKISERVIIKKKQKD